jgi:hemoglobin/transferrin/lactoferrin receptor protein
MSKGFTRPQFHYSVLTAALLLATLPAVGSAAEPTLTSARNSVDHAFSIAQQPLASALNGFSKSGCPPSLPRTSLHPAHAAA